MTYAELREHFPHLFINPENCPIHIAETEQQQRNVKEQNHLRAREQGIPDEWTTTGIVLEDAYATIIRDPVIFSDGSTGTYLRILEKPQNTCGVAIIPIFKDKIVLLQHFRHALRSLHIEIPRGYGSVGQPSVQTATKELSEEIGAQYDEIIYLGSMLWNSGLSDGKTDLFLSYLNHIDFSIRVEGITNISLFSVKEVEEMIVNDTINDSFTITCFMKARLKGLI